LPEMIAHQKKYIDETTLPDTKTKLEIFDSSVEAFTNFGYEFIGIDHFAKKSDSLVTAYKNKSLYRNFQGYTTFSGCDMISFGITAISDIQGAYKQNAKKMNDYYKDFKMAQKAKFSDTNDITRRTIIKEIMCNNFVVINKNHFSREIELLNSFTKDNLLKISQKNEELVNIELTSIGRFFSRNIASVFDDYLNKKTAFKAFSQSL